MSSLQQVGVCKDVCIWVLISSRTTFGCASMTCHVSGRQQQQQYYPAVPQVHFFYIKKLM